MIVSKVCFKYLLNYTVYPALHFVHFMEQSSLCSGNKNASTLMFKSYLAKCQRALRTCALNTSDASRHTNPTKDKSVHHFRKHNELPVLCIPPLTLAACFHTADAIQLL